MRALWGGFFVGGGGEGEALGVSLGGGDAASPEACCLAVHAVSCKPKAAPVGSCPAGMAL